MTRLRTFKPGKYGKGLMQQEAAPEGLIWRVRGGWNGRPHHDDVSDALQVKRPNVAFHIDKQRRFYFHSEDPGFQHPKDPAALAKHVTRQYPKLQWGKVSAEEYERANGLRVDHGPKTLALANRPLRPFEQGAHLHVLDWAHQTARYRFQAAGAMQVKAAARAFEKAPDHVDGPPRLPSLEAAVHGELRKLYALGHATVRSELDHQANGNALPIGLSAAPPPPNLRASKKPKKRCGTCEMFDHTASICWGYGNYPVEPDEVCDSWARDTQPSTLAQGDQPSDPGSLRARARLIAHHVAHHIWQAVRGAKLNGATPRQARAAGRAAGNGALTAAANGHASPALNAGRAAAALASPPRGQIIGARYTSVLDKNTCGPCADADTGQLLAIGSPEWVDTPNPACESLASGTNKCRCIHVYQLSTEVSDVPQPIAAAR